MKSIPARPAPRNPGYCQRLRCHGRYRYEDGIFRCHLCARTVGEAEYQLQADNLLNFPSPDHPLSV